MTMPSPTAAGRAEHWDATYRERGAGGVSWFQAEPATSLALIDALGIDPRTAVVDVGGGASVLVDRLAGRGFTDLTVVDISAVALDLAGPARTAGTTVERITADVLTWSPARTYGLWHDRAVFHFLTDAADRHTYLATLRRAVPAGGAVIVATFALDGPESCSGLPVARYGPEELAAVLEGFDVVGSRRDEHVTPWGTVQPFTFVAARRTAAAAG